jgi:hypothetical protein
MTEKKINFEIKENKLQVGVDTDQDGEKSLDLKVHLGEAIQEAFARQEAIEGNKLVSIKFELTKLRIKVDTDKDGEEVLDLSIDLGESFSEVSGLFKKDDKPDQE